jgi:hypothetical protein
LGVWHPFAAVGRVPPSLPFAPRKVHLPDDLSQERKATIPGRPFAGAKRRQSPDDLSQERNAFLFPASRMGYDATSPVAFPAAVVPPIACLGKLVPLVSLVPTPRDRDKRYKRYKGRIQQSSAILAAATHQLRFRATQPLARAPHLSAPRRIPFGQNRTFALFQPADRFEKRTVLETHHQRDRVAGGTAAEATPQAQALGHAKRGVAVLMNRAVPPMPPAAALAATTRCRTQKCDRNSLKVDTLAQNIEIDPTRTTGAAQPTPSRKL